jgi:hypothetical protein
MINIDGLVEYCLAESREDIQGLNHRSLFDRLAYPRQIPFRESVDEEDPASLYIPRSAEGHASRHLSSPQLGPSLPQRLRRRNAVVLNPDVMNIFWQNYTRDALDPFQSSDYTIHNNPSNLPNEENALDIAYPLTQADVPPLPENQSQESNRSSR